MKLSLRLLKFTVFVYCRVRFFLDFELPHVFRNKDRWNRACDYVANAQLKNSGVMLHKNALYNLKWHYLTPEQIYRKLKKENR